MEYTGDLYGKVGRRYVRLTMTTSEVDGLSKWNRALAAEAERLRSFVEEIADGISGIPAETISDLAKRALREALEERSTAREGE